MQPFPSPVYRAVQATYAPVPTMQHRPPSAHEQVLSASSRPPVPTLKPATLKPAPHEKLKLLKPAPAPGQDATQIHKTPAAAQRSSTPVRHGLLQTSDPQRELGEHSQTSVAPARVATNVMNGRGLGEAEVGEAQESSSSSTPSSSGGMRLVTRDLKPYSVPTFSELAYQHGAPSSMRAHTPTVNMASTRSAPAPGMQPPVQPRSPLMNQIKPISPQSPGQYTSLDAVINPQMSSSFGGQGTPSYGAALGGSSLYGSSHLLQTRNYKSSNGNILDFTIDALKSMQSDDKDVLILKLQNDLLEAQRGHQDSLNRTAMLSASNDSLKEENAKAMDREKEHQSDIEMVRSNLEASMGKLQMFQEIKENWTQVRKDCDEKDRQLEVVTNQLRAVQLGQSSEATGANTVRSEDSTGSAAAASSQGVVHELLRRLTVKDQQIEESKAVVETLSAEVRTLKSASADAASGSGFTSDARDLVKMKERVKMVEEALRAMRDEAREHVLAIKSPDIKLQTVLGSGSFAEVHKAVWQLPCAVKRLKDSVRSNRYEVHKFQKEAYLLRSLLHPGILRVFGFCKLDFLLVSEIVTGGSLNDLIHKKPQVLLSQGTVLEFTAQVSDILRYLHLCSVVHRDIKPENLLMHTNNTLKLADFGLACEKKGAFLQSRSNLAGTPRYMAPEAYRDEKCTEKIDIYSLAMMIWEMLTGKLPWDGSNFQDVRNAVAHLGKRPPLPPNLPHELSSLMMDCWDALPEKRPAAAQVLARMEHMGVKSRFVEMREDRQREERERKEQKAHGTSATREPSASPSNTPFTPVPITPTQPPLSRERVRQREAETRDPLRLERVTMANC